MEYRFSFLLRAGSTARFHDQQGKHGTFGTSAIREMLALLVNSLGMHFTDCNGDPLLQDLPVSGKVTMGNINLSPCLLPLVPSKRAT